MTELVKPPQMLRLLRDHDHELEVDVSEELFVLLGKAMHTVLERAAKHVQSAEVEKRLYMDVLGEKVGGRFDVIEGGVLSDWKITSVWSFLLGAKVEWEQQLNMLAALARYNGRGPNFGKLQVNAILRDWNKNEAARDPEYPQVPFVSREIPMWGEDAALNFMRHRVRLHEHGRTILDVKTLSCSDEERWKKPDVWAVTKQGNVRAAPGGLKATREEAQEFADNLSAATGKPHKVEQRVGGYPRCEAYCGAAPWCFQYQQSLKAKEGVNA